MRRPARIALFVGSGVLAVGVLLSGALLVLLQTDWGRERARRIALEQVRRATDAHIEIGRIEGDLFRRIRLVDVSIADLQGRPFLVADTIATRFSLRGLLRQRIVLSGVRLVRARVVLDHPPDEDWNYVRIFRIDPEPTVRPVPGWGDWITLDDVEIVRGSLTVRVAWQPPEDATPAERARATEKSLAGETRDRIVAVPGGFQNLMEFRNLHVAMPRIVVTHPDTAGIPILIDRFSGLVAPFLPPAAIVHDLSGRFRILHDSLRFEDVRAVMPGSRIAAAGVYALDAGDLLLALNGEPLAFRDMRWLEPDLPAEGGGSMRLRIERGALATRIVARELDVSVRAANVRGHFDLTTGDTLRFGPTELHFARVETRTIQDLFPTLAFPRPGRLSGRLALRGAPHALDINGDVTFADVAGVASRIVADGEIGIADDVHFRSLRVRALPLHATLVRAVAPGLPVRGTIAGVARLDGPMTGLLRVAGDMTLRDPLTGVSRFGATGGVSLADEVRFADLLVRLHTVQVDLVREFAPELPIGGILQGTATLDGAPATRIAVRADIAHEEAGERSHVSGRADIAAMAGGPITIDATLHPLSLVTAGRFAPGAGLHGSVAGELRVRGNADDLHVATELTAAGGGGALRAEGTFDPAAERTGYDVALRLDAFDLAAVTRHAPASTSLTGPASALGRGFDPATMHATFAADFVDVAVDDVAADRVRLRASIEAGLAVIDSSIVRLGAAEALVDGSFGIVATRHGQLAYRVAIDSLETLAPWLPGELTGSFHADGTLRGNIERVDTEGHALARQLVLDGIAIDSGRAEYALAGLGTTTPDVVLDAWASGLHVAGEDFDSATVRGRYAGTRFGRGEAVVAAYRDDEVDLGTDVSFVLQLERSELHIAAATLRLDTIVWQTARPAAIGWGDAGIEVDDLVLVGNAGGRIAIDGRLPVDAAGELDVVMDAVEIGQLEPLLPGDASVAGRLDLVARIEGTLRAPRLGGEARLTQAVIDETAVPDSRIAFRYTERELVADAELLHDGVRLATAEAVLPIDLSSANGGPRRLPGELVVDIVADSLPVALFAAATDQVDDVEGALRGEIAVRGTFDAADVSGTIELDGVTVGVEPLGVRFVNVAGAVRLENGTASIDSIVAWSGGPIRITGTVDVTTLLDPAFDLNIAAERAHVIDTDDASLHVDAEVAIAGPLSALDVSGEVRTRQGVIYIPEANDLGPRRVVNLEDPGTLQRLDERLLAEREALRERRPFLESVALDLAVVIDRDVWLRSTEANVEIYTPPEVGPFRIRKDGGGDGIAVEGTIRSDRGEYEFMSRRFRLTRGALTFVRGQDIDPLVQVAAEHEVRLPGREAFEIRVVLGGTARDLTITLESNAQPPISQTDLLSYVAFGRDASSLIRQQGSALAGQAGETGELVGNVAALATNQLAAVAMEAAVAQLERDLMRELRVDVFRITPADLPAEIFAGGYGDLLRGTEIEAGRYVTPRLFVAGQLRAAGRPGVRAEYTTPRGLQWQTSWQPRYLPAEPTLAETRARRTGVLGGFVFREWRF